MTRSAHARHDADPHLLPLRPASSFARIIAAMERPEAAAIASISAAE